MDARHVPAAHFAKGNYFTLSGKAPFSRLIYPVPEAAELGAHLTLGLGGQAGFGPDVQWVAGPDDLPMTCRWIRPVATRFMRRCASTGRPGCATER